MNQDSIPPAGDPQEEISALIRQLHETEERLRVLTEGKVDSVVHPSGASYLLHRAQGELLKSEAAQRALSTLQLAIMDALPAHIALLDDNGVVVAVNDAWKGFGSNNVFETADYGIGRNYIQICDQAHGECAAEAHQVGEGIKAVLRGEARSFSLEYPCHSPTEKRWFRVMVTPLHKGGAGGAVIMHVNVSERKLAAEALRESQEKFQQLVENITDVFWIRSADMQEVHYLSPAFERIWGRTVASVYENPQQWTEFVMPEDLPQVLAAFQGLMGEAPNLDIEYRIIRPDGEIRWVRVRGFKVRDESGKVIRYAGIVTDITEHHKVEVALRKSEQEQRELIKQLELESAQLVAAQQVAKVGSWETDLVSQEVIWSAETYRIFEADPASFRPTHQSFLEIVHPEDRAEVDTAFLRSFEHHGACLIEHRLLLPDGRVKHVEERWQVFRDEQGKPVRAIGTCQDITERKLAAAEVQRTSELLRAVADGTPDAVFVKDLRGRYLLFNEAAARFVGRRSEEVIGRDDTAIFGPEDAAVVMTSDRQVMNANQAITSEEVLTAAGVTRTYQATKAPYRDSQGKVIGLIGISRDITERKAMEQRATDEQLFNQTLIETSPVAIITYRASGEGVSANAASVRMLGAPNIATVQGQNFRQLKFWQETGLLAAADLALASGQPQELEAHGRNSFGKEIWIHCRLKPFTYAAQPYLLCFFDDIRERKWAEEQLAEQAALLDIAHEAIVVKDLEGQIIYWNKGAERIYGWTAAEAMGRKAFDLLYKDTSQVVDAQAVLLAKGEWQGEVTKVTKEGREIRVEARWTLVRDGKGVPKSIFTINLDITEKKKMEAQFLRAQRMESIGTLAGGIAHDLNNVLAPIMMSVEMLRDMVKDEVGLGILDTLQASAQRGADLVKQVLTFARGVEGQRMEVNVGHQLKEIQKVVRETFPKNIEASFKAGRELWPVVGDPTQLHQVFMNLLVNARDAMPLGGRLEVTTENVVLDEVYAGMNPESKPGSFVMIKVVDTGSGIPTEIRDRIFEPFFTTKEIGKGTGLGLSTVLAIVRSHGGFITVYSEVGKGTKFKVYLPARATAEAVEAVAIEQTRLPQGSGELVLVVDDEESIRGVAKKMLERYGYRVLLAANGAEAVALYAQQQGKVAVVITDMAMPVMDGPATIIALKAMNPQVKIIGSSGNPSNSGVAKAVGAGVQHFIPKPYTAEKMLMVLAEILKERA